MKKNFNSTDALRLSGLTIEKLNENSKDIVIQYEGKVYRILKYLTVSETILDPETFNPTKKYSIRVWDYHIKEECEIQVLGINIKIMTPIEIAQWRIRNGEQ